MTEGLPAWSADYLSERLRTVPVLRTPGAWGRQAAWGEGTGRGVKVAVVDSGVDARHPWVGSLAGGVAIGPDPDRPGAVRLREGLHDDLYGHGTACAGI